MLGEPDWRAASATLADAFSTDPVLSWLIPGGTRRRAALERFFAIETRDIVLAHGHSRGHRDDRGGLTGVALVLPPGRWRTPMGVQLRHGAEFTRIFRHRLPIALGVLTDLERRHPRDPHYYLPYIGVAAAAQGLGIGTTVLAPVLERCDREGVPAYLEASNPRSVRLYARLGFITSRTIRPLGAPPIELMTRAPKA